MYLDLASVAQVSQLAAIGNLMMIKFKNTPQETQKKRSRLESLLRMAESVFEVNRS
jgi:hypothetical protein